jgi:ABC-type nitrate/sulfonate/bicarbonate transport system substrate-binding protein
MKAIARVLVTVVVALVLAGSPAAAQKVVKVGYLPSTVMTVAYAHHKGFWKDEGLTVELELLRGGPAITEAMAAGSLHAGSVAYMPMFLAAKAKLPFYFLASDGMGLRGTAYRSTTILVRKDSPIKTVADLKGKTIAIHQAGTIGEMHLIAALRMAGLDAKDVSLVYIPIPGQPVALDKGQVDATVSSSPFTDIKVLKHNARALHVLEDVFPYALISGLTVTREFADNHPNETRKLVKGFVRAARWIDDHPDEMRKLAARVFKIPDDVAGKMDISYWPRNGYHVMPGVWDVYLTMVNFKMMPPLENEEKVIHDYFVAPSVKFTVPAVRELGEQPDPLRDNAVKLKPYSLRKPVGEYLGPWEKR